MNHGEMGGKWASEGSSALLPSELREFVAKIDGQARSPILLNAFAEIMGQKFERRLRAVEDVYLRELREQLDDPSQRFRFERLMSKRFPRWHFLIAGDLDRSLMYQRALEAQLRPGMIVLEIGAGSGILAMMAARAGASHVYACEMEPLLAEVARENVRKNGLSDKVTIIEKHSCALEVGRDLPRLADVVISEIVSVDLLGEGVLPVYEDLVGRVVRRDAIFIPDRIAIRGCIVGGDDVVRMARVGIAHGFDISAMNRYSPARIIAPASAYKPEAMKSSAFDVFSFALSSGGPWPAESCSVDVEINRSGPVDAFLHWIYMDLGAGITFENGPSRKSESWTPMLCVHGRSSVIAGERQRMHFEHDRFSFSAWPLMEKL